jgi:putative DNA primase/helicase
MYRRLAIIRLNAKFEEGHPNTDPYIEQKLEKELSGICNKLINAYRKLKDRGVLSYAEGIRKEVQEYREENDTVIMFSRDCVEITSDEEDWEKVSEVYSTYKIYCEMNGLKPLNVVHFGRAYCKSLNTKSAVRRVHNRNERVYTNMILQKDF